MSLFAELKRRNVFKVGAAYVIIGWLVMQVGEVMAPALYLPDWVLSALAFFLILGLPIALFFAWAFELTPEGLKKEKDVDRGQSITDETGQKLNRTLIVLLILAVGYFAVDKFLLDPQRDTEAIEAAVETAVQQTQAEATPGEGASPDPSIAVLPFVNISEDPGNEYFSDGLSEELLNLLVKVPELRVAARTSSFSFKGKDLEIPEIAGRLGVEHILEGSVRKAGNQVRITAQLVHADDGFHLWSETYDRTLDNIFEIQEEIAQAVVDALKVTLLGAAPKVRKTDPDAYQLYLQGSFLTNQRTQDSMRQAVDLLKRAVAIDPGYVPAWTELAYTYQWLAGTGGLPIDEGMALADRAVERALEIDPGFGQAHVVKGVSLMLHKFRFAEGVASYRRAFELAPGNAFIRFSLAAGYRTLGRFAEAAEQIRAAIELDPVLPEQHAYLGQMLWLMGDTDGAVAAYEKALSLSPNFIGVPHRLARVYLTKGDPERALQIAARETSTVYRLTAQAMAQHTMGDHSEADASLEELIRDWSDVAAYQVAEVYGFRGQADAAFEWLDKALDIRDSGLASILGDPAFRPVFEDPRWPAFLERLELAEAWRGMPPEWGGPQP